MKTPCWRGENTVLRGVFAVPRIYGFLKDLGEFQREMPHACWRTLRTVPCIRHVLKDLAELEGTSRCIYGFLKDLAKNRVFRPENDASPCNYGFLKDLVD